MVIFHLCKDIHTNGCKFSACAVAAFITMTNYSWSKANQTLLHMYSTCKSGQQLLSHVMYISLKPYIYSYPQVVNNYHWIYMVGQLQSEYF